MTRTLAVLALSLAACAHSPKQPTSWTVKGGTLGERQIALALVTAARRAYPSIPPGGQIVIAPEVATRCYGPLAAGAPVAGCRKGKVYVLWPHPKMPGASFERSALAHELGHAAFPLGTEAQASEAAEIIMAEYAWGLRREAH